MENYRRKGMDMKRRDETANTVMTAFLEEVANDDGELEAAMQASERKRAEYHGEKIEKNQEKEK